MKLRPHIQLPDFPTPSSTRLCGSHIVMTEVCASESRAFDLFETRKGQFTPTALPGLQLQGAPAQTRTIDESIVRAGEDRTVPPQHDIEPVAKQRVQLLAASYAGGDGQCEIIARLEILNTRLLAFAPRVSQEQMLALENANENLLRIRAAREERAKRLGLPTSQ